MGKTEAMVPARLPLRQLRVHNRLDAPVNVTALDRGSARHGTVEIEPGSTFDWGLRLSGVVSFAVAGADFGPETLSLDLTANVVRHVVVDSAGAREFTPSERRGPDHPDGIRRVQVGCGPHNLFPDWWNVDIREFAGVDAVMDVTNEWPFRDLDFVYGEHFIEHLPLDGAIAFLIACGVSLREGGVLRLTTPNLEWVARTHYPVADDGDKIAGAFAINRAFHGWGHQFLYSRPMLQMILKRLGYKAVRFFPYGQSDRPELRNLERHGGYKVQAGAPNLLVVEATRDGPIAPDTALDEVVQRKYLRFVHGGH